MGSSSTFRRRHRPGDGALVSVVVPVLDGGPHFPELLRSLAALDWPADRLEILLVDNGSTDDSAERARAAGATVLTEPERGAAGPATVGSMPPAARSWPSPMPIAW